MVTYHIPTKANSNLTIEPQQMVPEGANVIHHDAADAVNNRITEPQQMVPEGANIIWSKQRTGELTAVSVEFRKLVEVLRNIQNKQKTNRHNLTHQTVAWAHCQEKKRYTMMK